MRKEIYDARKGLGIGVAGRNKMGARNEQQGLEGVDKVGRRTRNGKRRSVRTRQKKTRKRKY